MNSLGVDTKGCKVSDQNTSGEKQSSRDPSLIIKDPELYSIIKAEKDQQRSTVNLVASENFTSRAVEECLASCLTNRYSEGQVGKRYYGGTQKIDLLETLCKKRVLEAFIHDENLRAEWGVNVQPLSGSPANFAALTGVLQPHDRIMFLDLASGGHLSHGFYTPKKKLTATSRYFDTIPYFLDSETGLIDFQTLDREVLRFRPKLIICGFSSFPRQVDFKRFRQVADSCGAYLLADISHISGLVATGQHPPPFPYAHIVTSTTHKTFRGPRGAVIFYNLTCRPALKDRVDSGVFPALQGGPHNNTIAGIAAQALEVQSSEFKNYIKCVLVNSKALGEELGRLGHTLTTGGTDTHMIVVDLKPMGVSGEAAASALEAVGIICNKNSVPNDISAMVPTGIRIGSAAMTTRGLETQDFKTLARIIDETIRWVQQNQENVSKDQKKMHQLTESDLKLSQLRDVVQEFISKFDLPGGDF